MLLSVGSKWAVNTEVKEVELHVPKSSLWRDHAVSGQRPSLSAQRGSVSAEAAGPAIAPTKSELYPSADYARLRVCPDAAP
jgi:hypothetical protein